MSYPYRYRFRPIGPEKEAGDFERLVNMILDELQEEGTFKAGPSVTSSHGEDGFEGHVAAMIEVKK